MGNSAVTFTDSKQHFNILDALRGVAAIIVIFFHILEVYSGGDHSKQIINHGYLAVDFFFMLSGFVIAYAYDDRWNRPKHKLSVKGYFKRRLIRLHPMIIFGMTVGLICFYFGQSDCFPKIAETSIWQLLLIYVIGCTLLPIPISMDIRGWDEMHPLDGPAWSLFFEYIANILYALILSKVSRKVLTIFLFLSASALIILGITSPNGDIIGGWSFNSEQLKIGFTRVLFPYIAGIFLCRNFTFIKKKNTFLWCSLILAVFLCFPHLGTQKSLWINGLYDALTIILIFPIIIYLGANGVIKGKITDKVSTFLGNISYPIYIIHFPFIYIYTAWVIENDIPLSQGVWVGLGILIFSIVLSYLALKFYDLPIRKRLANRFLYSNKTEFKKCD